MFIPASLLLFEALLNCQDMSVTTLFANLGGMLGLCMGFSMLSAVELLYFASMSVSAVFCRKRGSKAAEMN